MRQRLLAATLLAVLVALPVRSEDDKGSGPRLVSPGSAAREGRVGNGCPTFSWSLVQDADGYELTAYEVTAQEQRLRETPILRHDLPAGVTSWTPELGECLPPGRYGWAVAAIRQIGGVEARSWSRPAVFNVQGQARSLDREWLRDQPEDRQVAPLPSPLAPRSTADGPSPRSITAAVIVVPPDCDPGSLTFLDVPASSLYCRWIEQAARDQITAGCGGGNYCPKLPVTREQAAMLLEKARGSSVLAYRTLDVYGALETTPAEIVPLTVTFTLDVARTVLVDFGGQLNVNADVSAAGTGNTGTFSLLLDLSAGLGTTSVGGNGAVITATAARMIAVDLTAGEHTLQIYGSKTDASKAATASRLFMRVMLP